VTTQLTAPNAARAETTPESHPGAPRHDTVTAALIAAVATTLSTLAVASLLAGARWQLHALGSIVVVLAIGVVARAARLPRSAVVVAQLTACVGYVTAFYAGRVAVLGVFPGPAATARLRDRVDAGLAALNGVTPPFTPGHDVALLAVAGVAVTAIAVDALSVGYRRPLLAGVPLLVLYAVPATALPEGPRTWLFALPALGLLLLFVGDDRERLARWGLRPDRAYLVRSSARRTGARIGLSVVAISLIVPALVSTGSGTIFDDKGIGRQQSDPVSTLDPLVEMRRNLVRGADIDLLNVASDTVHPDEQYLRAVTLDEFTGSQWKAGDRQIKAFGSDLPSAPGLSAAVLTTPVSSSIRGLPEFLTDYLPLPYPAIRLQIDGKWRLDPLTGNVVSTGGRDQAAGREYTVSSLDLLPRREDVGEGTPPDPSLQRYLALPDLPKRIADTARAVTKGAQGPLEIGLRLQSWFRNPRNFTYDLRTPQGSGSNAVVDFLTRKRGYCEQFAATMAVMARSLGVPARVDVGFTAGDAKGAGRTISAHDAHAWPELFLPGVGWTRFEPTPGSASSGPTVPQWLQEPESGKNKPGGGAGGGTDSAGDQAPPPSAGDGNADTGTADATDCTGTPDAAGCQSEGVAAVTSGDPDTGHGILAWIFLFLLLLLVLAATPRLIRAELRRRRWASTRARALAGADPARAAAVIAEVAWIELRDTALDLGYLWPAARTPRQAAAILTRDAHLRGRAADALAEITGLVEQARYSAAGGGTTEAGQVRVTVEEVRDALALVAGRDARLLARVYPLSLRTSLSLPTPAKVGARVRGALRRVARRPA
jgi:transglutaminase-like putative cysteine protease